MLVLSRKKSERICINNDIEITIVEIRGDKVRLGIKAPREVPIHRDEVLEAIKRRSAIASTEFSPGRKVSCSKNGASVSGIIKANTNGNLLIEWTTGLTICYSPAQVASMGIVDIGVAA